MIATTPAAWNHSSANCDMIPTSSANLRSARLSPAAGDVPRISVLISTFGNRRFVTKKLAEIRAQTLFAQSEFIFIETASPDRERELLHPFCERYPNCRLLTTDDRRTLFDAWNLGWDAARAPLICYSNMDDAMHPELLRTVAAAMEQSAWDACSVLIAMQDEDDPQLDDWQPSHLRQLRLSRRPGPFAAWRTELKSRLGQFDGRFFAAGDLDFWARMVHNRLRIGLIRKVLYLFTHSKVQISKSAAHAERRDRDERLLEQKPYPMRWPPNIWREVLFWRFILRRLPALAVQPTGNPGRA